jgi:hypothetical protein
MQPREEGRGRGVAKEENVASFWRTLLGVLTAVAGVITAVA